jgi:hypothetical protein
MKLMQSPRRRGGKPLFYAIAMQISETQVKLLGKMRIIYSKKEADQLAKELRAVSGKPFVAVGLNIVPKKA